ncbi:MAG: FAD-dependent monooxygenase, partial [Ilumatobacteraceae bacterium]
VAASPHVTFLDGHEIDEVSDGADRVVARLTGPGGDGIEVEASWAVVAEGASSATRRTLGIDMVGLRMDAPNVDSLLFDSPGLSARLPGRGTQYWFLAPHRATVVSIDGADRYRAHVPMGQLDGVPIEEFLTEVVGPLTPVARFPWSPGLALATTYRSGRIFLAGDAAHIVTPYGGLGMNTGIEDAMNVASKLGAVVNGWAGEQVLDDYEAERRPIARELLRYQGLHLDDGGGFTLDTPLPLELPDLPDGLEEADDALRARAGSILDEQRHLEFVKPGLEFGIRYPVDGAPVPERGAAEWGSYEPVVVAGQRAPHAESTDGVALIDRLGPHLLVVGRDDIAEAVAAACGALGLPVETLATDDELYEGWTIVRPDGFVLAQNSTDAMSSTDRATLLTRLGVLAR